MTIDPPCFTCKHFDWMSDRMVCAAFPDGIPMPIQRAEDPHRRPYPSDRGIIYELDADILPYPADHPVP
jgi:hypothetical protein